MTRLLYILFVLIGITHQTYAQIEDKKETPKDSLSTNTEDTTKKGIVLQADTLIPKDTTTIVKLDPKIAGKRSALLPGYGQIYNKKWWKVPIIYGIFGVLGYGISWNTTQYHFYKDTYEGAILTGNSRQLNLERLRYMKNEFRRNKDKLIVITIAVYGLNVIDAIVDAHLSDFDSDNNISLRIKPQYERVGFGQSQGLAGIGFVLSF